MKRKALQLIFTWCISLILIRSILFHNLGLFFMLWNLFLAWVPYFLAKNLEFSEFKGVQWSTALLTLLFLPNAPYLVTDLIHLQDPMVAPIWFDILLYMSFALAGILYFLFALERMSLFLTARFKKSIGLELGKMFVFFCVAYGVFLGRFLRFNSWDLFSEPLSLFEAIARSLVGFGAKETWAFTLIFATFLYVLFKIYKGFRDEYLLQRTRNRKSYRVSEDQAVAPRD